MKNADYTSHNVRIGDLSLGSKQEILIQSMINVSLKEPQKAAQQIIDLYENGSSIVRLAVINRKEFKQVDLIREILQKNNYNIPLVADIHFNPDLAYTAVEKFEKVRINPGNFAEEGVFRTSNYTDERYSHALHQLEQNLVRLIDLSKKNDTCLRIGVNHGSLSKRILYRYGNTSEGMIASVLEHLHILNKHHFKQAVISLKSSDPKMMIRVNIELVMKLKKLGYSFPLHLGLTEAGNNSEARLKSALSIGTLLMHGIGDTIRVSLTENPLNELPFARELRQQCKHTKSAFDIEDVLNSLQQVKKHPTPLVISEKITASSDELKADYIFDGQNFLRNEKGGKEKVTVYSPQLDLSKLSPKSFVIIDEKQAGSFLTSSRIIKRSRPDLRIIFAFKPQKYSLDARIIETSLTLGELLLLGYGDGIWIKGEKPVLSFQLLQACGRRYSQAEFIMCPSCSRTNFDIERLGNIVKDHFKNYHGLKIAVMGCIINGPGEMLDADFGYIGAGNGKINLYKGSDIIAKQLKIDDAVIRLTKEIEKHRQAT